MTFRPSDDVLEEMADSQNSQWWASQYYGYGGYDNNYNVWNIWDWQQIFQQSQNFGNWWVVTDSSVQAINIPVEEVKAPDLSDLIKNSGSTWIDFNDTVVSNNPVVTVTDPVVSNNSVVSNNPVENANLKPQNWGDNIPSNVETPAVNVVASTVESGDAGENNGVQTPQDIVGLAEVNKMTDIERSKIVSWIEWSINWNLDFLVDYDRLTAIKKYKRLYRFLFRWGLLVCVMIVWVLLWSFLEVNANQSWYREIVRESSIKNKDKWVVNTSDKILWPLIDSGVDISVKIPYGSALINGNKFQSSSNLLLYKWIVVPQVISISYDAEDFVSLETFENNGTTRKDIENLIKYLITDRGNLSVNKNLNNVVWTGNVFQWSLIDWFNLICLNNFKASDIVCDQFLWIFNRYGKYYNLSYYADDLLTIVKTLKEQGRSIDPICSMIVDYTQRSWVISSDVLKSIMEDCGEKDRSYYKRLVDFIAIENSLLQPELSDEVFDDPDLNAYKLLSSQQIVYKFLDGTSLNENYIKSYLTFVQNLLNKDAGKGRYLDPIYKDILYLFNNNELSQSLLQKWKLSSDMKWKIDQINNWNALYKYPSLSSQLTTPNLSNQNWDYVENEVEETTIEDIFSKYYYMNDRLRIRKVINLSGDALKVQTELFTNKILSITNEETLKLTVTLYRNWNLLYVSDIKVANQPNFSDILNIYAWNWKVSFNDMLLYIDEQIWMRYQDPSEVKEENSTFCEQIKEREDISVYACDESSISLYKWDVEYNFELVNWILDSFKVGDDALDSIIKEKLDWAMLMRENTPAVIISIIDFTVESTDDNIKNKLDAVDQFRIHFKVVPDDIHDIEWESEEFLVDLTLWEFKLQAHYNVDTHLLTKISYVACEKTLEIRGLTIEVTTENEPKLVEILNNPRIFLTQSNPAAYKKYQRMCEDESETDKNKN